MKIKFAQGVELTRNQLKELPVAVMNEPDMGWEKEYHEAYAKRLRPGVYEVAAQGQYATYTYRVNTSWLLITVRGVDPR